VLQKITSIVAAGVALAGLAACSRKVEEPPASVAATVGAPAARPLAAHTPNATVVTPASAAPPHRAPAKAPDRLRFAVIGDYGAAGEDERKVADLVKAYHPEIVITTGDNNYPRGGADTIDRNIGQYYSEYIGSYNGAYGSGASENRFFPALGNHDWYTDDAKPYLDYFTLPGNERYYSFVAGPVEFFALDSDPREPDGVSATSRQAAWLKAAASASKATWQIVYFHHPAYSSGPHGSATALQWPYREWGVDLVLAGHDHTYERNEVDGLTYLVVGLSGNHEYGFNQTAEGSKFRYNQRHGAELADATLDELRLAFVVDDGTRIDEVVLTHGK